MVRAIVSIITSASSNRNVLSGRIGSSSAQAIAIDHTEHVRSKVYALPCANDVHAIIWTECVYVDATDET